MRIGATIWKRVVRVGFSKNSFSTDSEIRDKVLINALKYVPLCGWTDEALINGAVDAGLGPTNHKIIPRGPVELVETFLTMKRDHVVTLMSKIGEKKDGNSDGEGASHPNEEQSKLSRNENLHRAITAHIDYIAPHIKSWPTAIALSLDTSNIGNLITIAADTIEDLTIFANIDTVRMDWYAERLKLAVLYGSVELYMVQDKSENFIETRCVIICGANRCEFFF